MSVFILSFYSKHTYRVVIIGLYFVFVDTLSVRLKLVRPAFILGMCVSHMCFLLWFIWHVSMKVLLTNGSTRDS